MSGANERHDGDGAARKDAGHSSLFLTWVEIQIWKIGYAIRTWRAGDK